MPHCRSLRQIDSPVVDLIPRRRKGSNLSSREPCELAGWAALQSIRRVVKGKIGRGSSAPSQIVMTQAKLSFKDAAELRDTCTDTSMPASFVTAFVGGCKVSELSAVL